jgi:WD40 repeat protein
MTCDPLGPALSPDGDRPRLELLIGHSDRPLCAVFSADGSTLATGGDDRSVILWDVPGGCMLHRLEGHAEVVTSIAFSPDGNFLASAGTSSRSASSSVSTLTTETLRHGEGLEGAGVAGDRRR